MPAFCVRLADRVEFLRRLRPVGQRCRCRQSEAGEHHLLQPEFLGEGDALVQVLLQFPEAVMAALAAQPAASIVCRISAAGMLASGTEIRIAVRRTHFDRLDSRYRRVPAACLRNPWRAPSRTGYVWQPIGMPSGSASQHRAAASAAGSCAQKLSSVKFIPIRDSSPCDTRAKDICSLPPRW